MDNTTESLMRQIDALKSEVNRLHRILDRHGIPYLCPEPQPPAIIPEVITEKHAIFFYSMFRGRKDVFSRRTVRKDGRAAYYPACDNFWRYGICPRCDGKKIRCAECQNRHWTELTGRVILNHLLGQREDGTDVVGLYPMFPDETCYFLVFDFDNHDASTPDADGVDSNMEWVEEVNAMREICHILEVPCLVERSRSGKGAHIWLLFAEAIPAETARRFGAALLTKGAESVNQKSFRSYDRMLPAQDHMPEGGLGNLIALPLQGRALKDGNSAFIDENWNAYPDQWAILRGAKKLERSYIETKLKEWITDGILGPLSTVAETGGNFSEVRPKPWKNDRFRLDVADVDGEMHLVRANQIYVDTANLKPRAQNTLRRLASFQNPTFYKTLAMGYSVRRIPRIIPCYREEDGYLALPRGKWEQLTELLETAGVPGVCSDERQCGRPIRVAFQGNLYEEQQLAADKMLSYDCGILSAATAFGKTAVGAYLIAQKKVSTLILVHNREIMKNWIEDLEKFLQIDEEPPVYVTPKGRHKKRRSVIGSLYASHNSITGIIDVAMVSSLGKQGEIDPLVKDYGLVMMDECHHGAAQTIEDVLREVNARYVYGLTATPKRDDGMEQKVYMQFGAVRHRFTAKDKARMQGIRHFIYPRFTRLINLGKPWKITEAYQELIRSEIRNAQIAEDVAACIAEGRTPLVLTKFIDHAKVLYELLANRAEHVFILQGGRSNKERDRVRNELRAVPESESVIVIAIGKYIGEGFNYPRLDTMMLAAPISWEGNVEQYAGRLHRDYKGKKEVVIYDYVDSHVRVLERMYHKRLRAYKKIGYEIYQPLKNAPEVEQSIFGEEDCFPSFLNDLQNAKKELVIASPGVNKSAVSRFLAASLIAQTAGVRITVLTLAPDSYPEKAQAMIAEIHQKLKESGIFVRAYPNLYEHFAIIDGSLVWYGTANLLSKIKDDDNMMRLYSAETALELQETVQARSMMLSVEAQQL